MNTDRAVDSSARLYALAGWLSILHAVIIVPRVGLDHFAEAMSLSGSGIVQLITGFQVVGELVGIYVLFMFRRLLNERHSFHQVDSIILSLVFIYAASAILGIAGLVSIPLLDVMFIRTILYFLASLVSIVYAVRLLRLDSDLSGLLKPYVYTTIAGRACMATVVLMQVGSLIYVVSLVVLGMILIRAESEPEYL